MIVMKRSKSKLLPMPVQQKLSVVGEQIKLARLRRKLTIKQIADRATCSELTVIRIEKGNSAVSIGAYIRVLYGLGLADDILHLAGDDLVGRSLEDARLMNPKKKKEEEYDFD